MPTFTKPRRASRCTLLAMFTLSLVACGDSPSRPAPSTGSDDDRNAAADEVPVATLSVEGELGATEIITVTFSEAMDPRSLSLGGSLADDSQVEWGSADRLTLTTEGYWPPGAQTLVIDANARDGQAMQTLEASVSVRAPFRSFQHAVTVIGQQDFSGGDSRQSPDALSAGPNTLDLPGSAVAYADEKDILFISDTYDSRVLGFHGIPEVNNANADFVIGQPDFVSSSGGTSRTAMRKPQGISAQGGHLIVGDPDSNRLLIYPDIPAHGPGSAAVVVGQADFTSFGDSCGPSSLNHVHNHFVTPSGRLLVADGVNSRVLVWNEIPDKNGSVPDLVIGQSTLNHCAPNDADQNGISTENEKPSARTLQHPTGLWSDDERLVVVDNYNNRVLIWNTFPEDDFAPADIVLGQAAMDAMAPNDDDQDGVPDARPSARVLNYPWSIWVEGNQLFVADERNSRVLVWNEWPTASFTPADAVIGQADFKSGEPNAGRGTPAANTLRHPKGVRVIRDRLLVTDTGNSRVLIFRAE